MTAIVDEIEFLNSMHRVFHNQPVVEEGVRKLFLMNAHDLKDVVKDLKALYDREEEVVPLGYVLEVLHLGSNELTNPTKDK